MKKESSIFLRCLQISLILFAAGLYVFFSLQSNLWFDEAYTYGLVKKESLWEMIRISSCDVHPPLYYILLWLFTRVCGTSVVAMRLFSALGAVLFCALGYTHIRKDFGEKAGFWFTFFAVFSGAVFTNALEIRMYSWLALFAALTLIYAGRRLEHGDRTKDRVLFIVFSVATAYTHYYGLLFVSALNIALLLKDRKDNRPLKNWYVTGAWQIAFYLPGIAILARQLLNRGGGWQSILFPNAVVDFITYPLLGEELDHFFPDSGEIYDLLYRISCLVIVTAFLALAVFFVKRFKQDENNAMKRAVSGSFTVFCLLFAFVLWVSVAVVVYQVRYLFVFISAMIFAGVYLFSGLNRKAVKCICAGVLVLIFAARACTVYSDRFAPECGEVYEFARSEIGQDDVIINDNINGNVISVLFYDNEAYFYNSEDWSVEVAYLAFGNHYKVKNEIKPSDFYGAGKEIVVLGKGSIFEAFCADEKYENVFAKRIFSPYHDTEYFFAKFKYKE